jgi:hypothetical protein
MSSISVVCVIEDTCEFGNIEDYCSSSNIDFSVRVYNSTRFPEDRIFVAKLPAFHIYEENNIYTTTLYQHEHTCSQIQQMYEIAELKKYERLAKRQIWNEKLKFVKRAFKRLSLKTDSMVSESNE